MSQAIKKAVYARMISDPLAALVAKHPADATKPAILNGRKSQFPPVYDCVTYRIESSAPDKRFRPGQPGQAFSTGVEDFYLDCEAWTQTPDSAPLDAINARLDILFHQVTFTTNDGPVFFAERILRQDDDFDKTLNSWFALSRFRLRLQRTS